MEMKMSCVCLVLGLVLLMTVSSEAYPAVLSARPDVCCFHFMNFKIPVREILKIEKLHPSCPYPGYVFTVPRGRLCAKELQ
ncbi:hypothetical protein MHYP_G00117850 [Metynnis hypsauchen]